MNKDFHYYATYFAAISVGFSKKDAEKIAWAAEMVDELDQALVYLNREKIPKEYRNITVQNDIDDMAANADWSDDFNSMDQNGIRGIWSLFHFLPGHFEGGYDEIVHKNNIKFDNVDVESFNKEYVDACLKLRCGKNSETVRYMLWRVRNIYKEKYLPNEDGENFDSLYAIGIAMHILADTWAHDDFSGVPCYFVNSVRFVAQSPDQGFGRDVYDFFNSPITDMGFPSVNSAIYIGHGQINHAPDYDFLSYKYYPRYLCPDDNPSEIVESEMISINNPERFEDALLGLYNAMNYIIGKTDYYSNDVNEFVGLADEVKDQVFTAVPKRNGEEYIYDHKEIVDYKISTWKKYLGIRDLVPPDFLEKNGYLDVFSHETIRYRHDIINFLNNKLKELYKNPIILFDEEIIDKWMRIRYNTYFVGEKF